MAVWVWSDIANKISNIIKDNAARYETMMTNFSYKGFTPQDVFNRLYNKLTEAATSESQIGVRAKTLYIRSVLHIFSIQ